MDESTDIKTPFSGRQATLKNQNNGKRPLIGFSIVAAICLITIGILLGKRGGIDDRYRTVEVFPISDYLSNCESLLGGTFKLSATVEAELGTEEDRGKLVAFRESGSSQVVPVLIPSRVIPAYALNKAQRYRLRIEVGRGGLLSATDIEKN